SYDLRCTRRLRDAVMSESRLANTVSPSGGASGTHAQLMRSMNSTMLATIEQKPVNCAKTTQRRCRPRYAYFSTSVGGEGSDCASRIGSITVDDERSPDRFDDAPGR